MTNKTVPHKFHLVDPSPWPLLSAISAFILVIGTVLFFQSHPTWYVVMPVGLFMVLFTMFVWWRDVIKEGREDKAHSDVVRKGLTVGMLLFILSEVMFFFGFFFSFFNASIDPAGFSSEPFEITNKVWPPAGTHTVYPWNIPFLNTLILLLSGTTVTWAHYELIYNNQKAVAKALLATVLLGIAFTGLQIFEYWEAEMKWSDNVFSSNFYMITGFHGFHVIVGTIFLAVCFFRAKAGHFARGNGHLGFEFASWYWHFVDVIWLFLFVFVYIWGS